MWLNKRSIIEYNVPHLKVFFRMLVTLDSELLMVIKYVIEI